MKTNLVELTSAWLGDEFVVEADFQGKRICIRCRYDTYQRCWTSDVFLVEECGLNRFATEPCELYSTSKLDSMRLGFRMAMNSIQETERLTAVPPTSDLIISVRDDEFEKTTDLSGFSIASPIKRFTNHLVRRLRPRGLWTTIR